MDGWRAETQKFATLLWAVSALSARRITTTTSGRIIIVLWLHHI
jgi:hypothetical protein